MARDVCSEERAYAEIPQAWLGQELDELFELSVIGWEQNERRQQDGTEGRRTAVDSVHRP